MKNKKFQEAFSAVRASDDMRNTVMALPAQARTEASRRGWKTLARVAACAAVVALLIGAMVLPGKNGEPVPFFTIHVYANETDSVELTTDNNNSVISNVPPPDGGSHFPGFDSAPPSSQKPMFFVDVWLDTDLSIFMPGRESERPTLTVLCNGEVVENEKGKDIMIGFLASTTSDDVGYSVAGRVDKPSMLEITLIAPDNTILQKCIVLITPALSGGYVVKLIYTYVTDAYAIGI